jgi:hypothetical protein
MRRPSPAVAVALTALFFALTGAGAAAQRVLDPRAVAASSPKTVFGPVAKMCASDSGCGIGLSAAVCPAGTDPVGGGWVAGKPPYLAKATVVYNGPSTRNHRWWTVEMINEAVVPATFKAVAVCLP